MDSLICTLRRFEGIDEAAVPVPPDTWAGGHYVSGWAENTLELSENAILKSSDKPQTRESDSPLKIQSPNREV
jgi:hypothetical protein